MKIEKFDEHYNGDLKGKELKQKRKELLSIINNNSSFAWGEYSIREEDINKVIDDILTICTKSK